MPTFIAHIFKACEYLLPGPCLPHDPQTPSLRLREWRSEVKAAAISRQEGPFHMKFIVLLHGSTPDYVSVNEINLTFTS